MITIIPVFSKARDLFFCRNSDGGEAHDENAAAAGLTLGSNLILTTKHLLNDTSGSLISVLALSTSKRGSLTNTVKISLQPSRYLWQSPQRFTHIALEILSNSILKI